MHRLPLGVYRFARFRSRYNVIYIFHSRTFRMMKLKKPARKFEHNQTSNFDSRSRRLTLLWPNICRSASGNFRQFPPVTGDRPARIIPLFRQHNEPEGHFCCQSAFLIGSLSLWPSLNEWAGSDSPPCAESGHFPPIPPARSSVRLTAFYSKAFKVNYVERRKSEPHRRCGCSGARICVCRIYFLCFQFEFVLENVVYSYFQNKLSIYQNYTN